jgi:V8-like Glu-specific endopeptidase
MLNRPLAEFERASVSGRFVARTTVQNPRGENFRLYFDQIAPGDGAPFVVRVVGLDGVMGAIGREEFTRTQSYASDVFVGAEVAVEIEAEREPQGLSFRLVEIAYETPGGAPLSVTIPDQRRRVSRLSLDDPRRARSNSVAKLTFRAEDGVSYLCTGFMVAPSRLLTNEHCINNDERCSTMRAIFGYLDEAARVEQARCRGIVVTDPARDLALIELDRRAGDRWGVLTLASAVPAPGATLYMPQHPDGRPQEISITECGIIQSLVPGVSGETDFSHGCDTEGGASGSPVIDAATQAVVGLHHWGFEAPPSPFRDVNRAVRIDSVREILDGR